MNNEIKQNKTRYAFTKKKASTTTILPTNIVVERISTGTVEHIKVIDAEVVGAVTKKRPSFFISQTILKVKGLWRGN